MHAHTKENVVVIDKLLLRQQDELVRKNVSLRSTNVTAG